MSGFQGYGSVKEYRDDPSYDPGQGSRNSDYNDLCEKVGQNITSINSGANSLDRAMKVIGTEKDSEQLRDRIHDTSQKTKRIVADTAKLMKNLASMRQLDRQKKYKIDRLSSDFEESVRRFTSLQRKAAEKVKTSVRLTTEQPKNFGGEWQDDNDKARLVEQERRHEQLQQQEEMIEDDLALIRDREERIRQLEADVLDVNEIFKDLNVMIHEQGETIDSIEANVEQAYGNVEEGTKQLGKAADYQKKSRKKLCILLLILFVIVAIIAIIVATQVSK